MHRLDLRNRLVLAISAGSAMAVACGSSDVVEQAAPDASLMTDARSDATGAIDARDDRASVADTGSDGADAANDASARDASDAADAPSDDALAIDATTDDATCALDAAPDACAAYGQACTQDSDCCNGVPCTYGGAASCNGQCGCRCGMSIRRPFLVGSSMRSANVAARGDWQTAGDALPPASDLDPTTARALARDWLRDALEEHASIAAFARFTMHLLSVGAPPELVLASQAAARDEVRHARACFALARRYGGAQVGPAPLSLARAMEPMTLAEIAALTAEEGCVGETLGALLAEAQLARTTDPVARAVLARANLARDEQRHAELAWAFVSWAVARGGEPVRRAVAGAIARAVGATLAMPIKAYAGVDMAAWRAHGRFACAEARALAERGVREVIEPCVEEVLRAARVESARAALRMTTTRARA